MNRENIWWGCCDVEKLGKKFDCCSSCHEDANELSPDYPLGEEYYVDLETDIEHVLSSCCSCPNLTDDEFKDMVK